VGASLLYVAESVNLCEEAVKQGDKINTEINVENYV